MSEFIELPVSFFDAEFTLNPYSFLQDLYQRDDILGFSSEGMNFLFRHDDCRAVLNLKILGMKHSLQTLMPQ